MILQQPCIGLLTLVLFCGTGVAYKIFSSMVPSSVSAAEPRLFHGFAQGGWGEVWRGMRVLQLWVIFGITRPQYFLLVSLIRHHPVSTVPLPSLFCPLDSYCFFSIIVFNDLISINAYLEFKIHNVLQRLPFGAVSFKSVPCSQCSDLPAHFSTIFNLEVNFFPVWWWF